MQSILFHQTTSADFKHDLLISATQTITHERTHKVALRKSTLKMCRRIVVSPSRGFYRIMLHVWEIEADSVGSTNLCVCARLRLQAHVNGNKSGNGIEYLEHVNRKVSILLTQIYTTWAYWWIQTAYKMYVTAHLVQLQCQCRGIQSNKTGYR